MYLSIVTSIDDAYIIFHIYKLNLDFVANVGKRFQKISTNPQEWKSHLFVSDELAGQQFIAILDKDRADSLNDRISIFLTQSCKASKEMQVLLHIMQRHWVEVQDNKAVGYLKDDSII